MVKVLVVGMGPIGLACARAVLGEREMQLVGMVDADLAKVGKRLDEIDQQPDERYETELKVAGSIDGALSSGTRTAASAGADVAIVTTTSKFDRAARTVSELLAHRVSVVSSCEEMAWPRLRNADLAGAIDRQAKTAGRAVVGTGVNPGFVMDCLPVVLSTMVQHVTAVRCVRRVDASTRRLPLQAKVGAGMTPEEFTALGRAGKIGHVGLPESVALLAGGLGRRAELKDIHVTLEPVIAERPVKSLVGTIQPGQVRGIHNVARWSVDELSLELNLTMALGLDEPYDLVELAGPVPLKVRIEGGVPGDSATVAAMLNYAHALPKSPPGLHTMLSLPLAGCRGRERG